LENFKMAGSTLLFSEVLDKVHKAKTKDQKVKILREHNTPALKSIIKASFDPKIQWVVPAGDVPYKRNDAPIGTEHTVLATQANKLWHFIRGADNDTPQFRKEEMFIQMCEGLHETEAALLVNTKDKKLHQIYKGLSANVVKEAFGWDDNFMIPDTETYPQAEGLASGVDR
tara:strand:+ start:584 stop:1096 length:513 start_codon:yes stop_codon:yes gene_type:complete